MTAHDHKAVSEALQRIDFDCPSAALVIRAELEKLRERCETLQFGWDERAADARRYRWLKLHLPPGTFGDFDVFDSESWDAAIDRAGGGERENGNG